MTRAILTTFAGILAFATALAIYALAHVPAAVF